MALHVEPVSELLKASRISCKLLSEPSGTARHAESVITVRGLADDLRDAIVEYQVSINIERHAEGSSLMQFIGRAAEGDLQAEP